MKMLIILEFSIFLCIWICPRAVHLSEPCSKPEPLPHPIGPHPIEPLPKPHPVEPVPLPHPHKPIPPTHPHEPVPLPHPVEPVPLPHPVEPVPLPHPVEPVPLPHPVEPCPATPEILPHPIRPVPEPYPLPHPIDHEPYPVHKHHYHHHPHKHCSQPHKHPKHSHHYPPHPKHHHNHYHHPHKSKHHTVPHYQSHPPYMHLQPHDEFNYHGTHPPHLPHMPQSLHPERPHGPHPGRPYESHPCSPHIPYPGHKQHQPHMPGYPYGPYTSSPFSKPAPSPYSLSPAYGSPEIYSQYPGFPSPDVATPYGSSYYYSDSDASKTSAHTSNSLMLDDFGNREEHFASNSNYDRATSRVEKSSINGPNNNYGYIRQKPLGIQPAYSVPSYSEVQSIPDQQVPLDSTYPSDLTIEDETVHPTDEVQKLNLSPQYYETSQGHTPILESDSGSDTVQPITTTNPYGVELENNVIVDSHSVPVPSTSYISPNSQVTSSDSAYNVDKQTSPTDDVITRSDNNVQATPPYHPYGTDTFINGQNIPIIDTGDNSVVTNSNNLLSPTVIGPNTPVVDTVVSNSDNVPSRIIGTDTPVVDTVVMSSSNIPSSTVIGPNRPVVDTIITSSEVPYSSTVGPNTPVIDTVVTSSSEVPSSMIIGPNTPVDTVITSSEVPYSSTIGLNGPVDTVVTSSGDIPSSPIDNTNSAINQNTILVPEQPYPSDTLVTDSTSSSSGIPVITSKENLATTPETNVINNEIDSIPSISDSNAEVISTQTGIPEQKTHPDHLGVDFGEFSEFVLEDEEENANLESDSLDVNFLQNPDFNTVDSSSSSSEELTDKDRFSEIYDDLPKDIGPQLHSIDEEDLIFDIAIYGTGPGILAAVKTLADLGKRVIILEKGTMPPILSISLYYRPSLLLTDHVTGYEATAPDCKCKKVVYAPNMLGGVSSYSSNTWDTGSKRRYKKWGEISDKWGWESVHRYYKSMEYKEKVTETKTDTTVTQTVNPDGTVSISTSISKSVVTKEVEMAFVEQGLTDGKMHIEDENRQPGFALIPVISEHKHNVILAQKMLKCVKNDDDIKLALNTIAKRIILSGDKAVGIEVQTVSGRTKIIYIREQLILGTGPIATIQLLTQSGIGVKSDLEKIDIPLAINLPYLGKDLVINPIYLGLCVKFPSGSLIPEWDSDALATEYLFGDHKMHPGMALNFYKAFLRIGESEDANVQVNFYAFSKSMASRLQSYVEGFFHFDKQVAKFVIDLCENHDVLFLAPQLLTVESRGSISIIRDEKKSIVPKIDTGMFDNEQDMRIMLQTIELIESLAHTKSFRNLGGQLLNIPIKNCWSTDKACSARYLSVPNLHYTGGVIMGKDFENSVVNEDLIVHGTSNIYCFNAGVIPHDVAADSVACTSMVGHYGAEIIAKKYSS